MNIRDCLFSPARSERIALVLDNRNISYGELSRDVARVQQDLKDLFKEDPSRPIGIVAQPDYPSLVQLYALLTAKVAVLPLSPRLSDAELVQRLAICRARTLLQAGDIAWQSPLGQRANRDDAPPPCAFVFSSGSSGTPKAVELSHRAMRASALASELNLGWVPGDRWLAPLSYAHIGGLSAIYRCLLAGTTLVLSATAPGDEAALASIMGETGATIVSLVPTQLYRLLQKTPRWNPDSRLRAMLVGGAALAPRLYTEARARGWPILPTYGLTEACSQVATVAPHSLQADEHYTGIGKPLQGWDVRIEDGGIEIRGPALFTRYWTTSGPSSLQSPDDWFRTNDCGHFDEAGHLHVLGRADDAIICGGNKLWPAEIEGHLLCIPEIAQVAVIGAADKEWGEIPIAFVIPVRDDVLSQKAWDEAIIRSCPAHLRPRRIVIKTTLPQLPSGKRDLPTLRGEATLHKSAH